MFSKNFPVKIRRKRPAEILN